MPESVVRVNGGLSGPLNAGFGAGLSGAAVATDDGCVPAGVEGVAGAETDGALTGFSSRRSEQFVVPATTTADVITALKFTPGKLLLRLGRGRGGGRFRGRRQASAPE